MTLEITPEKTRIGWIGTGVMGSSMCGHLVAAGYRASVYNRSADKAKPLVEKGAKLLDSPKAVAEASDVVFTIVGYPKDVREVTLGENGTLAGARAGAILVDMTTSEPALAVEIDQAARAKGVHSVDAPVSGGDVGAREARLSIMVGGDKAGVRCAPAAVREDGQDDRLSGPGRGRTAHQDGQPGADRQQHDRRLRGVALRVQGRARPERGAPERLVRGGRVLEPEQSGAARDRGQLRAGIFRRALSQGHGNRPRPRRGG